MSKENFVTLKIGKTVITCKPEDVGGIMASMNGPASKAAEKPIYEKSTTLRKAIINIEANNPKDLVLKALANRNGIHTVISGLNNELRERFNVDPRDITSELIAEGLIKGRPAKRGFWITNI